MPCGEAATYLTQHIPGWDLPLVPPGFVSSYAAPPPTPASSRHSSVADRGFE